MQQDESPVELLEQESPSGAREAGVTCGGAGSLKVWRCWKKLRSRKVQKYILGVNRGHRSI